MKECTRLVSLGRDPERFGGMVNTPLFRGSTILSRTMAEWEQKQQDRANDVAGVSTYGRFGTPTTHALEDAMARLEGGHRALLFPSGLAAIATTLTALLSAGDHVLVTDSAYAPTRTFLARVLKRYGVEMTLYDPHIGAGVDALMRPNTRVVYVESPGSETFEIQDIPAIAAAAHRQGARVVMDNTWGTPLFFKPFQHGVDVSVLAATKYIVGHSDAMLGIATCTREVWPLMRQVTQDMGQTAGPEEAYLALRGLRTMDIRLRQHGQSALRVARWLQEQEEVEAVLHPALADHPGHALWKRYFTGACGLFSMVLRTSSPQDVAAFVDNLQYFGLGVSWGGYESLVVPFTPGASHTGARWPWRGQALRLHVGLEDADDLIADLAQALAHMTQQRASSRRLSPA
jgi:cystathionine beta-lyase